MKTSSEILERVFDPADTSAGGGSASALAGAMAAALLAMVCRLPGPEDAPGVQNPRLAEAGGQAVELSERLQLGSADDRLAFEGVRAAFRLPKGSQAEREERGRAVQAAWLRAAEVPLANADLCWAVLGLAFRLDGRTNLNALSDYRCARLLARAGLLGCLENVQINLPMIKEAQAVERLAAHAERLRAMLAGSGGESV